MATIKLSNTKQANRLINYCDRKATERDGLYCVPEYAREQFKWTREAWDKNDGIQAHHVIQSFDPKDNITPEQANEIGKELAERIAPGHQALIYTHTDREHIHNHIVINAVSFEDGKKYHSDREQLFNIRQKSDELCKEHGLSIVKEHTAQERFKMAEYKLAERGKRLWKDELRSAIEDAKKNTHSLDHMKEYLKEKYNIDMKIQNKNVSFLHPEKQKYCRGKTLGEAYTKETLQREPGKDRRETKAKTPEKSQDLDKLLFTSKSKKAPALGLDQNRSHSPSASKAFLSPLDELAKSHKAPQKHESKAKRQKRQKTRQEQQRQAARQGPEMER